MTVAVDWALNTNYLSIFFFFFFFFFFFHPDITMTVKNQLSFSLVLLVATAAGVILVMQVRQT